MITLSKGKTGSVHFLGRYTITQSSDNIALPAVATIFSEYLNIHFFPEDIRQFRALFPEEKV